MDNWSSPLLFSYRYSLLLNTVTDGGIVMVRFTLVQPVAGAVAGGGPEGLAVIVCGAYCLCS